MKIKEFSKTVDGKIRLRRQKLRTLKRPAGAKRMSNVASTRHRQAHAQFLLGCKALLKLAESRVANEWLLPRRRVCEHLDQELLAAVYGKTYAPLAALDDGSAITSPLWSEEVSCK